MSKEMMKEVLTKDKTSRMARRMAWRQARNTLYFFRELHFNDQKVYGELAALIHDFLEEMGKHPAVQDVS